MQVDVITSNVCNSVANLGFVVVALFVDPLSSLPITDF